MTRAMTRFLRYSSDLVIWFWTILFKGESCHPYNVGSDEENTISDLAQIVSLRIGGSVMNSSFKIDLPISRYVPATERIMSELELELPVSLVHALVKTHDYSKAVT
jgi:dTDP-glucose 4,6-dehydratase